MKAALIWVREKLGVWLDEQAVREEGESDYVVGDADGSTEPPMDEAGKRRSAVGKTD